MSSNIDLRHMRYFAALAEEHNFTRAARRLRIAQPSLSLQIRQLEDRIGTVLFSRKPRLELTSAGKHFLVATRQVLRHVHHAVDAAQRIGRGKRSVLHVGLASSAALTRVPMLFRQFVVAHPDLDLRVTEMHSADQLHALRTGMIDVGISRETTTESGFTVRELIRESFVAVLPARHASLRTPRFRLERCAAESFVLFPRAVAPMLRDQIDALCRESGFVPRIETEAREWHTIIALVAAGLGITIAPISIGALRIRGVVFRSVPASGHYARLFLCHPAEKHHAVRILVDSLVAGLSRRRSSVPSNGRAPGVGR